MIDKGYDLEGLYDYLTTKKCKDIAFYDFNKEGHDYKYVILVTVSNVASNKKFASLLMEEMGLSDFPDGYSKGEWIIFDFGDIVLHSFVPETREKYSLDKLYSTKKLNLTKQNKK